MRPVTTVSTVRRGKLRAKGEAPPDTAADTPPPMVRPAPDSSPPPTAVLAHRDLRLGGAWTAGQRAKNDALWLAARLLLGIATRLRLPALRRAGRAVGLAAHAMLLAPRRTALANVARVFPELDERERRAFVRACFATLGTYLGETVAMLSPRDAPAPVPLTDEARAVLESARAEARGVVFASAHLGPWERVAAGLVSAGVPLVTMVRESYDPRFSRIYDRLRSQSGVRVVPRAQRGATAQIVRTLREGGVLGMPMDLCSRVASMDAPFLGHDAPTAIGPARIALRTGAAVVVGTAAPGAPRHADSLVVTATRIPTDDLPAGRAGVAELTGRLNRELSRRILDLPNAWVWMHERWRTQSGYDED